MLLRFILFLPALLCTLSAFADENGNQAPLNIVFILADDLGWNDTDLYQENSFLETPNIERLASQGLVFRNAYSNSPLCSPTRASILTGQTPARHGSTIPTHHLDDVVLTPSAASRSAPDRKSTTVRSVSRLDTSIPTLSSILKENDYQTAHFGKWHLGSSPYSPLEHGFDIDIPNFAGAGPIGGYLAPWRYAPNLVPQKDGEHIDIRLAHEAVDWINQVKDDGPFFLNFWAFSVHGPFDADPEVIQYFENKRETLHSQQSATYAAMVKQFDDAIGILYAGLIEAGLASNTVIVFTSDNGGNHYSITDLNRPTSNFPLRAGKASIFEGGVKVPTFVIWPGLTQSNTQTDAPIQSVDFFPTILNGLSLEWPSSHQIDGKDFSNTLSTGQQIEDQTIYIYYPYDPEVPDWVPSSVSVISNDWKLIRSFHYGKEQGHLYYLFDLENDPYERVNLSESRPDKVEQLDRLIESHLLDSNAITPLVNPNFDSSRFSYDSIGMPADNFSLFKDAPQLLSKLTLSSDANLAEPGQTVRISYEINDESTFHQISYAQFMGPEVQMQPSSDGFSFTAPTVYVSEFVGFAFQAFVGNEIINKQIAVEVQPVQAPPTIEFIQSAEYAVKGESYELYVNAKDPNKERLFIEVVSEDALSIDVSPLNTKTFHIQIPADFDKSSIVVSANANDGKDSTQASLNIRVLNQSEADELRAEANKSGGSFHPYLLFILICMLISRQLSTARHPKH